MINWNELFELQKEVDKIIMKKIGRNNWNDNEWDKNSFAWTMNDRRIAFKVELCELANEIGFFKYWKTSHKRNDERIKDEWADCLAFLLSMIITKNLENYVIKDIYEDSLELDGVMVREYKGLMNKRYEQPSEFRIALCELFWMMSDLGYTNEELILAYKIKTKENIRRAKEGY